VARIDRGMQHLVQSHQHHRSMLDLALECMLVVDCSSCCSEAAQEVVVADCIAVHHDLEESYPSPIRFRGMAGFLDDVVYEPRYRRR